MRKFSLLILIGIFICCCLLGGCLSIDANDKAFIAGNDQLVIPANTIQP